MDISLLSDRSIRLKGKTAALIINPTKAISKTVAEGVVKLWDYPEFSDEKVDEERILIQGPGDYEVGGIKVSTSEVGDKLVGRIEVDGVKLLVGSGSTIEKISDKTEGGGVALVDADSEFNHDVLATIEPSVLIVYGPKSNDVAKSLGKSDAPKVSKFTTSPDKLPEEMQFIQLG